MYNLDCLLGEIPMWCFLYACRMRTEMGVKMMQTHGNI